MYTTRIFTWRIPIIGFLTDVNQFVYFLDFVFHQLKFHRRTVNPYPIVPAPYWMNRNYLSHLESLWAKYFHSPSYEQTQIVRALEEILRFVVEPNHFLGQVCPLHDDHITSFAQQSGQLRVEVQIEQFILAYR